MKRTLLVFLALMFCFFAFAGCIESDANDLKFEFSYEIKESTYLRGEKISITATVKNVSGKTYSYKGCSGNDFIPQISLYTGSGEEQYSILPDPIVLPTDVVEKKVKNGESGSIVYSFPIPDDAKFGRYSITLSFGESKQEFVEVLKITEVTSQNDTGKFGYCSTVISCGGQEIKPVRTLVYANEYSITGGEALLYGDGVPFWEIFSHSGAKLSDIPTIVANEKIEISPPEHSEIYQPDIRNTNFESLDLHSTWDELHLLPEGEYLISFYRKIDSRDDKENEETYWIILYENVFRLVILPKELRGGYHSLVFNNESALAPDFNAKEKYRAGDTVRLKLVTLTEHYYRVYVNGEEISRTESDLYYSFFEFVMPDKDAHIEIQDVWVDIPRA